MGFRLKFAQRTTWWPGAQRRVVFRCPLTPYPYASPAVIQIMISQNRRLSNLEHRPEVKRNGNVPPCFGFAITALEWYANFDSRTPLQKDKKVSTHTSSEMFGSSTDPPPGSCSPGDLKAHVPQWVFYLLGHGFRRHYGLSFFVLFDQVSWRH
jgi:hypothetical protein